MVPMPPASDVPPMTAAAMTFSSVIVPVTLAPALSRAVMMIEATPAQEAHQREDLDDRPLDADAGELGALRVAADREDVAAEAVLAGDHRHDQRDRDEDQHRNRQCPWHAGLRLLIGVHHARRRRAPERHHTPIATASMSGARIGKPKRRAAAAGSRSPTTAITRDGDDADDPAPERRR